jgi:hypothetical protein
MCNMKKKQWYEHYPLWTVFFSNLVSVAIYILGAFILYQIGLIWLIVYLIFIGILEFRLIKRHCVNCHYYGKTCAFGKGRVSSIFFIKGDVNNFCNKQMTWKDVVPDFMVSVIPMMIGIILLIKEFRWILLSSILLLFILTFIGNGMIRNQLACKYCKQREMGCPADQLFNKKKK